MSDVTQAQPAPRGPVRSRPKLVATDLDGTLLDARGQVSPRTQRVLAALAEEGIVTVFVTARPPRWLHPLASALDDHGIAICANGAFVYRVGDRKMLQATGIPLDVVNALVGDIRRHVPGAVFAAETAEGAHMDAEFAAASRQVPGADDSNGVRVAPIESVSGTVGKLLVRSPQLDREHVCEKAVNEIAEIVADRGEVQFSGAIGLAEIGPTGVTKASTLAQFCTHLNIDPADVWAFGDMPNDLPMLRFAGRSFAVANAHPAVMDAATDRAGHHDDDGVALALEALL